jgi:hypothetical protein
MKLDINMAVKAHLVPKILADKATSSSWRIIVQIESTSVSESVWST